MFSEVGDNGLAFFAEKHEFRRLSLAATKVSDVGLKYLANLKQLESLSLSGTNITQRGLIHLQGLTNLKFLALSENEIRILETTNGYSTGSQNHDTSAVGQDLLAYNKECQFRNENADK